MFVLKILLLLFKHLTLGLIILFIKYNLINNYYYYFTGIISLKEMASNYFNYIHIYIYINRRIIIIKSIILV